MEPGLLQAQMQQYGTVGNFVRELIKSDDHAGRPSVAGLRKLMPLVAPEAGDNPGERTLSGQLYFIGGLIGLRVMKLERGTPFMSGLFSATNWLPVPEFSEIADRLEMIHRLASMMMAVGDDGYREAEPYHATITHIGSEICTTVDQEPYVRRGFGLTMYMARQVVERNRELDAAADLGLMRFEAERAATGDWDAAWANLQKESD